jgi:hypothetical protein
MTRFSWLALALLTSSACVVRVPVAPRGVAVQASVAPPPARVEVIPPSPGGAFVWVPGHWTWGAGRYVWAAGRWQRAPRGHVWVPGHWEARGRHWVWVPGYWRR